MFLIYGQNVNIRIVYDSCQGLLQVQQLVMVMIFRFFFTVHLLYHHYLKEASEPKHNIRVHFMQSAHSQEAKFDLAIPVVQKLQTNMSILEIWKIGSESFIFCIFTEKVLVSKSTTYFLKKIFALIFSLLFHSQVGNTALSFTPDEKKSSRFFCR